MNPAASPDKSCTQHRGCTAAQDHLAISDEINDFVLLLQLLHMDRIEKWNLTPIEFGIMSWHLHNFYWYPRW
jgi:hypothetical protein